MVTALRAIPDRTLRDCPETTSLRIDPAVDGGDGLPHILLAQHHPEVRAVWGHTLQIHGFDVVCCRNRLELACQLRLQGQRHVDKKLDLVICDAELLDEPLRIRWEQLQQSDRPPRLVIILRRGGAAARQTLRAWKPQAVSDQPYNATCELTTIHRLLKRKRYRR